MENKAGLQLEQMGDLCLVIPHLEAKFKSKHNKLTRAVGKYSFEPLPLK